MGNVLTPTTVGNLIVDANQLGNSQYYDATQVSLTIVVNKGMPTVSAWPTASPITFGQTLASSTLTGGTASVPGNFAWTTPTTVPAVGTDSESVTFTPTDATNYNTVAGSVQVVVSGKKTPTITWATPAAITYGTALSGAQLNATANVAGSFVYNPAAGTTPKAGTQTLSTTFTPTDTTDYATASASVQLVVNQAVPTVSAWPTASAIAAGQALSASTLTGGTASVPGSFAWISPTIVPPAGTDSEGVVFTPTDATDYATASASVQLVVNQAVPTVSAWPTASAIAAGQALSASTLTGGTASVPGSFAWISPTIVPPAGTDSEGVVFTPTDATDYMAVSGSVAVLVNPTTPLIVSITPRYVVLDDFTFFVSNSFQVAGFQNGDVLHDASGLFTPDVTLYLASGATSFGINYSGSRAFSSRGLFSGKANIPEGRTETSTALHSSEVEVKVPLWLLQRPEHCSRTKKFAAAIRRRCHRVPLRSTTLREISLGCPQG